MLQAPRALARAKRHARSASLARRKEVNRRTQRHCRDGSQLASRDRESQTRVDSSKTREGGSKTEVDSSKTREGGSKTEVDGSQT